MFRILKSWMKKTYFGSSDSISKAKHMKTGKYSYFTILICIPLITSSQTTGNIAYVRTGTEISMINPDGTKDRRIWTHPDITEELGIYEIGWSPDGKELAFSSSHEATYSLYHADIYTIHADGTGLRKLTNSPARDELDRYPKGSVSVTLRNDQPSYVQSNASAGVFIVYIAGANEPQQVTLPPGSSKTIMFKSVSDFGNKAQAIVAMWGKYRWFIPGVDVQAEQSVTAPPFSITGDGIELFGAFQPVWRSDGSRISYRSGVCTLNSIPTNAAIGEYVYNPIFGGKNPLGTCFWDWGPNTALADKIIYTENASGGSYVYQITEGKTHPGTKLVAYSDLEYQILLGLHWLPDGSGFLFSNSNLFRDAANLFKFDFASNEVKQVTNFEKEFFRAFSISPDGKWVVFERAKSLDDNKDCDLWIMNINGEAMKLLVKNGSNPSWGK